MGHITVHLHSDLFSEFSAVIVGYFLIRCTTVWPHNYTDSALFQTANGSLPGGSVTTLQYTNAHITQNNTIQNKQNKKKTNQLTKLHKQ
jgi:hypothetical protein